MSPSSPTADPVNPASGPVAASGPARPRVLVAEKVGASGIDLLGRDCDVELGIDWSRDELLGRIAGFDAILIRSATQVDAELIDAAPRLRAIGRAGVGVDNVDVAAATRRGIVVANAPLSNVITAAEHTLALLLALARNIPQAHASLTAGRWERAHFSGVELYEKTLGILGFGRIGQLVAQRARAFGMTVIAYDPVVAAERYAALGVEQAEAPEDVYAVADFLTLHLPKTPETAGWLNADVLSRCKDGVRVLNVARGPLVVEADLVAALDAGKVGGAALDVFSSEPMTDSPLFGRPNVVVTPHLGASTAEANDRAGLQAAEQILAALSGGSVTTAVNIPAIAPEDIAALSPYIGLSRSLGRIGAALTEGSAIDRVSVEFLGGLATRDTRLLAVNVLVGVLAAGSAGAARCGVAPAAVNEVNAPALADERGIARETVTNPEARDYTDLIRVTVTSGADAVRVVGTVIGSRHRPHLLEAWGQRFQVQLEEYLTLFRYRDVPGIIGRVGTIFGAHGINIGSSIVGHGRDSDGVPGPGGTAADGVATMVLTTDVPVPDGVIEEILAIDGFIAGRTVEL
ncbi:phosphoglycerate dehydrogenase [Conexibacter sp. DBS9H8]|uniref:phosphoglycerate dehydrogenase n=1 Tax=Conexibacter sp. DBS9H8 TaxID=2937801 RepID=UPI00200C7E12|nr:phosphoglycerate dehydrogenase [Conexibacter sp. DBS9H8]